MPRPRKTSGENSYGYPSRPFGGTASMANRYPASTDAGSDAGRIPSDEEITRELGVRDDVGDRVVDRRRDMDDAFDPDDANAQYFYGVLRFLEAGYSNQAISHEFDIPPSNLRFFLAENRALVERGIRRVREQGDTLQPPDIDDDSGWIH